MNRRRYRDAAVIVDICREHGLWFDADELACVLRSLSTRKSASEGKSSTKENAQGQAAREASSTRRRAEILNIPGVLEGYLWAALGRLLDLLFGSDG